MNNFFRESTLISTTYNSEKVLKQFLSQIILKKFKEIIIIDNASNDKTLELIKEVNLNNLKLIKNKINKGYPFAINQGYKISKTKYVLIINPDTLFSITFSKNLMAGLKRNSNFTVIAPTYVNESNLLNFNKVYFTNNQVKNKKRKDYFSKIPGPCFIINKKKLDMKKFWDDNFFFYFDDQDLLLRLAKKNIKILNLFDSIILNRDNKINETNHIRKFKSWHYGWSLLYFSNKHFPEKKKIYFLIVIKKLICYLILFNLKKAKKQYFILKGMISYFRKISAHSVRDIGPF